MRISETGGRSLDPISLVIFDLDGTLADTVPDIASAAVHTASKFGFAPPTEEFVRNSVGGGAGVLMRAVAGPGMEERLGEITEYYTNYYNAHAVEHTRLYPDVSETLCAFYGKIRMAVATAKVRKSTLDILDHFGILRYFDMVVAMSDMPRPKPDPSCVEMILKQLGAVRGNTLFVGDTMTDVMTAVNAGIDACAVTYGYGAQSILQHSGDVPYIIDSFGELRKLILA